MTILDVEKEAMINLINSYDNQGYTKIQIVQFSTHADSLSTEWMSVSEAINAINGLTDGGWTNYDGALADSMDAFHYDGKIDNAQNLSYFFTDGEPTYGSTNDADGLVLNDDGNDDNTADDGIQATEEQTWIDFLNTNSINSFAVGVGDGVSLDSILPIAYNGITGENSDDTNAIAVTDLSTLNEQLNATIATQLDGDLLNGNANDYFGAGADGGYLNSIVINGDTYSFDGTNLTSDEAGTSTYSFDDVNNIITIISEDKTIITVDMDDGNYSVAANPLATANYTESVSFSIVDRDGDSTSAQVAFSVLKEGKVVPSLVDDTAVVYEEAIDSVGTNPSSDTETVTGNILEDDTLNGTLLTNISILHGTTDTSIEGVITVTTQYGNTLVVNSDSDSANYGYYTYTLLNAVKHYEIDAEIPNTEINVHEVYSTDEEVATWGDQVSRTSEDEMRLEHGERASKTFDFGYGHANQEITISFSADPTGYDGDDIFLVSANGESVAITSSNDLDYSFTTTLDENGSVTVNLEENSDNTDERVEIDDFKITGPNAVSYVAVDTIEDSFTYTVEDIGGTEYTANLDVTIHDDAPISTPQEVNLVVEPITTNVSIIADISGSMSDQDLADTEAAIEALINSYGELGNVNVNIVQFYGNGYITSDWISADDALALVSDANALYLDNSESGTDIEQGLREMVENSYSGNQPTAEQDVMYFFGDGDTYDDYQVDFDAYTGVAADARTEVGDPVGTVDYDNPWSNFVTGGEIDKLFTYSVNTSSVVTDIAHLADNGENVVSQDAVVIDDIADLEAAVSETAALYAEGSLTSDVGGTALIDLGADGGYIESIIVGGGVEVFYDANNLVQIVSGEHGDFEINFETGAYRYMPTSMVESTERIEASIIDGDGDTLSSQILTVNVSFSNYFIQAPEITQGDLTVIQDEAQVIGTAIDPNGTIDSSTLTASHGTVVLEANGDLTYTPDSGYIGSDIVSVSVTDDEGNTTTEDIAIDVLSTADRADAPNISIEVGNGSEISNSGMVEIDTFTNETEGWRGNGVSEVGDALHITNDQKTAYKTFDFGSAYAGKEVTITFDTQIDTSAWETDDSMQVHINGVDDVYSKTEVDLDNASHTLSATLDDEGKLKVEIFNNTDSTGDDTEWLEIDNFQIVGGNSYEYQVDLSASLTDSTETLNDIIIADLPVGISFEDSARNPITVNADGTFTIAIPDDGGTPTVWMISTKEMTNADIDALTASVTSVSAGGDMATAEATPTRFSAPIVTQGDTEVLEEASEVIATITDSDGSLDHASFSYTTDNGGTVVLEANGDLTYTSARNYSGNDTVHLTISDNEGRTTTHDIAVSISGVADTPTLYMGIDEGVLIPELPFGDTDNFTGGASNEWTGDNVTFANEEMEIEEGYNTALKMFDFGILSANQTVTIEFVTDIKANKWDGGSDNFRVYNNGTEIYQDGMTSALTEDADLDNYITHTFTTTLNASGEAEIEFYTDSRGSDEFVRIDNFSITGVQPEYYEYTLSINAGVTDSNETLSNMLLANLPNDVIVEDSNGEITPLSGEYALTMDTNGDSIVTIKSLDQLSTTEMNSISASVTSNDSGDTISTNVTIGDNDTIVYDGTAALDTGDGFDTIVLATGVDLGTGGIDFSNLDNIEKIDLSDNGAHTVIDITLADVMDMTDPGRVLTIDGIGGEDEVTVNTTDFTLTGTSDGYNTYEGTSGSDSVTLKVEENIDSTGL